jgi:hypothetical protein
LAAIRAFASKANVPDSAKVLPSPLIARRVKKWLFQENPVLFNMSVPVVLHLADLMATTKGYSYPPADE